jgi:hypothetical protein
MAGFTVPRRTAEVTFEGTDYDGAVLRCRLDVALGLALDFAGVTADTPPAEQRDVFLRFGDEVLINWNIEDENGDTVPADGPGLLTQPPAFVISVISHWVAATSAVPAPLGRRSPAGGTSAARSIRRAG